MGHRVQNCRIRNACLLIVRISEQRHGTRNFGDNMNRGQNNWVSMPVGAIGGCAVGFGGQSMANGGNGLTGDMFQSANHFRNFLNYQQFKYNQNHNHNSMGLSNNSQNQNRNKLCRNGQKCDIRGCGFHHSPINKQCRNGNNCSNKESTCLFMHDSKNE